MEKSNWKVFVRTQSYLKPYVVPYVFFVLVSGLGQFLTFSSVGVFLKEIVLMVSSSTSDFTIQKGILYLFATFCFTCFMGFGILNIKKIEQKIRVTLRKEMLNGYIHSDEKEVEKISDTEVMNRMSMDLTKMVDLVGWIMAGSIYMPVISGFLSVIYLCHVDFWIAFLCVFISVIEYYLLRLFSEKRMQAMQGITLSKNEIVNFLNEEIDGAKEVRTYGLLTEFQELLEKKIVRLNQFVRHYNAMNATRLFVSMFYIECIEEVVLLMAGAYLSSIGAIVFANIMIAIQLSDQINQMIVASSVLKMFVDEYAVYEKRVFEIIDLKPQIETRKIDEDSVLRMEQVCFSYDALFKDLVDICKNTIVILTVSTVKINRHWQFNDISAYEWYLFQHRFHICFRFPLSHVQCIFQLLLEYDPVQISLQMSCTDSMLLSDQILCLCMQFIY